MPASRSSKQDAGQLSIKVLYATHCSISETCSLFLQHSKGGFYLLLTLQYCCLGAAGHSCNNKGSHRHISPAG